MPHIEVEARVAGPAEMAYAMAKDMESYPRFMSAVRSLRVVSREPDAWVSDWVALLKGRPIHWQERDEFDDAHHVIRYRQTSGDLKKFEGEWRILPEGDGCRVILTVDLELGIPMLSGLLNPVARLVAKENAESMVAAIKAEVEARAASGPAAAGREAT